LALHRFPIVLHGTFHPNDSRGGRPKELKESLATILLWCFTLETAERFVFQRRLHLHQPERHLEGVPSWHL
jgi:hypothetical protein